MYCVTPTCARLDSPSVTLLFITYRLLKPTMQQHARSEEILLFATFHWLKARQRLLHKGTTSLHCKFVICVKLPSVNAVTDHLLVYSPDDDDDDDDDACGLFNEMSAMVACFCAVSGLFHEQPRFLCSMPNATYSIHSLHQCICRLLTGKTPRNGRVGLDGLGSKMTGTDELGKRLRKKKRARVASPQPDSRSQNSVTVSSCLV